MGKYARILLWVKMMYKRIINEICRELKIKVTFLSKDWIMMLEANGMVRYLAGYKFDLNNHGTGLVVDDKYAMYTVLKTKNIPVIEHQIMYDENNLEEYAKGSRERKLIYEYFWKHDNNIVIKVNNGTCGKGVYHVTDEKEIKSIIERIFLKSFSISLCPFYEIDCEYRVILLNGEILLVYGKIRPIVVGDGKKKLSQLLTEFNPNYEYKIENDIVLARGERYCYSWKHNLANGAKIEMMVDDCERICLLAKQAAQVLNLQFGSVDIIKTNGKYLILECNSGVMMNNLLKMLPNGYEVVKGIYKRAIMELFKND